MMSKCQDSPLHGSIGISMFRRSHFFVFFLGFPHRQAGDGGFGTCIRITIPTCRFVKSQQQPEGTCTPWKRIISIPILSSQFGTDINDINDPMNPSSIEHPNHQSKSTINDSKSFSPVDLNDFGGRCPESSRKTETL